MSRTTDPVAAERRAGRAVLIADPERDRGTALLFVLVLIIIGSMMMLPLARYSTTVLRANSVLTNKTKRVEAVKAGLRLALAECG